MVRTRFAPSPTGTPESIHLGFVIRALWNYALAQKNHGQFILRIEDTDTKRSRKDTEEAIISILKLFGIHWDEGPDVGGPYGPYRQSERLDKYQNAARELVARGFAYYDFDTEKRGKEEIKASYQSQEKLELLKHRPVAREMTANEVKKRLDQSDSYVIRAKIPEDKIFEFEDWILCKKIRVLGKDVPDLILLKSDGFPTYHLAVVVDDIDMRITHIIRGQEWISTTPIHLHIYEGLVHPVPEIGHFTVVLDSATGKKFSKRDITAKFGVSHWLNNGYLIEAVLNYLMLLGWAPKDNRELFTLDEFVEVFDQSGIQKSNPIFDEKKLNWFSGYYIRHKSDAELINLVQPYFPQASSELLKKIIPLTKERVTTLKDFAPLCQFFLIRPRPQQLNSDHLQLALNVLSQTPWAKTEIDLSLLPKIKEQGWKVGDFFMTLRLAITGQKITPPLTESMLILGKEESLSRLKHACSKS